MTNTDSPLDNQAENTDNCQHNWNSTHDPNSKIYWIGQCMNCGKYNTDEINEQIELYCHKQVIEALEKLTKKGVAFHIGGHKVVHVKEIERTVAELKLKGEKI